MTPESVGPITRRTDVTASRFDLSGRVALIVGGSRGIGSAISEAFAGAGAEVLIVGRQAEALEQAVDSLRTRGARASGIRADIGDVTQRGCIVPEAIAHSGHVDILVNSAAAKPPRGEVLDRETDYFANLLEVNVRAHFDISLSAARQMRKQRYGRIINISSSTGLRARSGMAEYGITKAAQLMMTRAFAVELGQYGITVNTLVPILTRTDFSEAQLSDESDVARVLEMQAIKRILEPEDIVGAALLLASEAGAMITGSSIVIDGGADA